MFERRFITVLIRWLAGAGAAGMALGAGGLAAQTAPATQPSAVSQPVIQPLPTKSPGMRLNDALNTLARNPQDAEALIAAGRASLDLGDVQAAIGFYQRAGTLRPGSVRAKVGLAGGYVMLGDPIMAIDLFNQAEKLGPLDAAALSDRGLAFDLVGDNQTAQIYYRRSLDLVANDDTSRRLALSQAIAGDKRGMDQALAPQLERNDKVAWRTLAFGQAILGNLTGAESIVRQNVPQASADKLVGYMAFMPRLTPAQQAAAGNLGVFPRSAEIGQDDARFAQYARSRVTVASAAPLPPSGVKPKVSGKDKGHDASPPPATTLAVSTPPPAAVSASPGFAVLEPSNGKGPGEFDLGDANRSSTAAVAPPVQATIPPVLSKPRSLDEAFAGFDAPSREAEPQVGAVDIRAVRPASLQTGKDAKNKAKTKDSKPDKPSHPSRIWVQVATGRDKGALGFDWRRMGKEAPELFKGLRAHTTSWGQSNRLLAGPFATQKEANAFLAGLKKAKVSDGFIWTSPAGQIVDALGVK